MSATENTKFAQNGDTIKTTTGSHGSDISSQRIDQLDKDCIEFALKLICSLPHQAPIAIDLGCGLGAQSLRLASLGCKVWMLDLMDHSKTANDFNTLLGKPLLHAVKNDIQRIADVDLPAAVDIVYSQRFIHYLPYPEAVKVLSHLHSLMSAESRLFLSASGIKSDLSVDYEHKDKNLAERFSKLAPDVARNFEIFEPVCLYKQEELSALGNAAGFSEISVYSSDFGNVKGVFSKGKP